MATSIIKGNSKIIAFDADVALPASGNVSSYTITIPAAYIQPDLNYDVIVTSKGGNAAYLYVFSVSTITTTSIGGVVANVGVSGSASTRPVRVFIIR